MGAVVPSDCSDGRTGPASDPSAKSENGASRTIGSDGLPEKRRLLLLVRTGLTLAIAYLLVFSSNAVTLPLSHVSFAALYLASNLFVAALPTRVLATAGFDIGLILVDTAATLFALYLMPEADADVFVFYFAIILLASISNHLLVSLLAPLVTGAAYVAFLLSRQGGADILQPAILLRLPFFLLAGAFYGFFVDRARKGQAAAVAAQQRESARTEFLSLITHDLKQPLWVAQQSAALLYEQLSREESSARTLTAQVMLNLRRMEALTLNFLDFRTIESRRVRVFPRRASLNRVVEDLVATYRASFELKGLSAKTEVDQSLPAAWIDPLQVERALANLLDNAVKFSPEGGVVVCRTEADGDWVTVTIGDSGPGISAERAQTLFAAFQAGTDAGRRRSTGLGLYIARAIVAAHGGELTLDSTAPRGAWFRVRLPAARPRQGRDMPGAPSVPSECAGVSAVAGHMAG